EPVPGLPHGHAGAAHDAAGARRRAVTRHRDDLREPLHARGGARAAGRAHRDRRRHRRRARRRRLPGRAGDGLRPARVGRARAGGARGARHDRGLAYLPPRPRLRAPRAKAGGPRRPHRAHIAMKNGLTLALPKGRLLDPALDLLRELGVSGIDPDSRKLIFRDAGHDLEILLLKPADVPARGIQVEIVRLDGSIELAPLVGLADRIVDLVQSGETLRANGLVEVAEITRSTARVIVNRASMKTEHGAVTQLIDDMRARLGASR